VNIPLDRDRAVPLARQIQAHLERLISERLLGPGVKLPATRELAQSLGVNRATVALAYEELVAAGWARAHVGQGTFVAERASGAAAANGSSSARSDARAGSGAANGSARDHAASHPPIPWGQILSRSARIIDAEHRANPAAVGEGVISFAGGMPDSGLFPTDAFRRVLNDVIRDEGDVLLQYYPVGGYPPLRRYLSSYLLRFGIEARPDEILIVNGSQQGFDLIARTLIDPGDVVAIEQPTYPRAMQVFRAFGARLLAVERDAAGPRPDAFERLLERHAPKLFYCQPSAHNPTGLTMGLDTGRRLLAAASRHQVPIVEDGFDGSLYYGARPAGPLKAFDRDGVVIYIGTFSKILFPGLRLGWLVAPAGLAERLQAAKQLADLHTSALIQAAVHRFCERKLLDRHLTRVAAEYGRRRTLLLSALRRRMPEGVEWTEPQGGFSLLVTLPAGYDAAALLPKAIERGVAFTPGAAFFLEGAGERTLRLSFSSVPAARIDDGIRRLADLIKAARRRPERPAARASVPLV
jgi:DNA-binding transcriptional MocR family regulator